MSQDWTAALDRLDADLAAAEQLLAREGLPEVETWTVPVLSEPLPVELLVRVEELRTRQAALVEAMSAEAARVRRQILVTDRIGRATRAETPALYIDASV